MKKLDKDKIVIDYCYGDFVTFDDNMDVIKTYPVRSVQCYVNKGTHVLTELAEHILGLGFPG